MNVTIDEQTGADHSLSVPEWMVYEGTRTAERPGAIRSSAMADQNRTDVRPTGLTSIDGAAPGGTGMPNGRA
ncbi:hypothetical protein GCM10027605_40370 [Micromonospora zhanjiangensis]